MRGSKVREFVQGQNVLVQDQKSYTPKWITGEIVKKLGPLSYSVQIDGVQHKHRVNQLLPSTEQVTIPSDRTAEDFLCRPP